VTTSADVVLMQAASARASAKARKAYDSFMGGLVRVGGDDTAPAGSSGSADGFATGLLLGSLLGIGLGMAIGLARRGL
jgi:hypothetical protein